MVIEGLRKSDSPKLQQKAFEIAEKWVLSNYFVYTKTSNMWEKYNVNGSYPDGEFIKYKVYFLILLNFSWNWR